MNVLSAAVPGMVRIDHFRASSEFLVRWSSLSWLQRYLGAHGYNSSITAVPDPDSSHSRLSFALEHRAQCFPGHSRMLPGGGGESYFSLPWPMLQPVSRFILLPRSCLLSMTWLMLTDGSGITQKQSLQQVCGRVFRLSGLPPACLWGIILTRLIQDQ